MSIFLHFRYIPSFQYSKSKVITDPRDRSSCSQADQTRSTTTSELFQVTMKSALPTQWPVVGSSRPENAKEHAKALMQDFDLVKAWLEENCKECSNFPMQKFKETIALDVKHGVGLGLRDVSQGLYPKMVKKFDKKVIERGTEKEGSKGFALGVVKVMFGQLYKSYAELNAKLAAKDELARSFNPRSHQRLPKRLPQASVSPCSSRNVSENSATPDGKQTPWSDEGGTRRGMVRISEASSELSKDHCEESPDRCCICGTLSDQEEHIITTCCHKSVGSICFEEAMQETGGCCLCQKTQSHFESKTSSGQSEQEPNYRFRFVETQTEAEDSRKDKSITGTFDQLEPGDTRPPRKVSSPSLVPGEPAKPLKCPRKRSEWKEYNPKARKLEDTMARMAHGTGSFSNLWLSDEESSIHRSVQRSILPDNHLKSSLNTKEHECVLHLSDHSVISYLKGLSRENVTAMVSEALKDRLSTTIYSTTIFGILLLESGDVQFKYGVKEGGGPDLEVDAASLAETLAVFVRARVKPYLVVLHCIETKSMNLCNKVQRTRAVKDLVRLNAFTLRHLSRPEDIRTIRWTTDEKSRRTIKEDSVILGLATVAQANEVIARGLLWKGKRRPCVKYEPKQNIIQCYNCQSFGHIAKTCKSSPRCRACAECHQSKDCPLGLRSSPSRLKCALCGGPHCASYWNCPVRGDEEIRLQVEHQSYLESWDNGPARM